MTASAVDPPQMLVTCCSSPVRNLVQLDNILKNMSMSIILRVCIRFVYTAHIDANYLLHNTKYSLRENRHSSIISCLNLISLYFCGH